MLHGCGVCLTPVTAIRVQALCPTDHTALRTSGAVSFYWLMVTYTSDVANVSGFVLHWEWRSDRTETVCVHTWSGDLINGNTLSISWIAAKW